MILAVKLSRSPLGVIALSQVLVFGIVGFVSTSDAFERDQRTILVWFIVLYPVFLMLMLYRLVAFHHKRLYGPSDFADEANFLQYSSAVMTKEQIRPEDAEPNRKRSQIEYKILKTLWTKQVNRFPDYYSGLWTFQIAPHSPIYPEYREAGNKLIGEGFVRENDNAHIHLTHPGFEYCKEHHKDREFLTSDEWWPNETIKEDKLAQALET